MLSQSRSAGLSNVSASLIAASRPCIRANAHAASLPISLNPRLKFVFERVDLLVVDRLREPSQAHDLGFHRQKFGVLAVRRGESAVTGRTASCGCLCRRASQEAKRGSAGQFQKVRHRRDPPLRRAAGDVELIPDVSELVEGDVENRLHGVAILFDQAVGGHRYRGDEASDHVDIVDNFEKFAFGVGIGGAGRIGLWPASNQSKRDLELLFGREDDGMQALRLACRPKRRRGSTPR